MQQSDAHDAAALVAKLRASSSSGDVQAECCKALRGLRLEGDAATDVIDAIVAALRHGVDHATLQRNGYGALSKLLRDNAEIRVSAAAGGTVEAVVAGLRAHSGDVGVQAHGCETHVFFLRTAHRRASRRVLLAPSKLSSMRCATIQRTWVCSFTAGRHLQTLQWMMLETR
jgi:hypothetical protein